MVQSNLADLHVLTFLEILPARLVKSQIDLRKPWIFKCLQLKLFLFLNSEMMKPILQV